MPPTPPRHTGWAIGDPSGGWLSELIDWIATLWNLWVFWDVRENREPERRDWRGGEWRRGVCCALRVRVVGGGDGGATNEGCCYCCCWFVFVCVLATICSIKYIKLCAVAEAAIKLDRFMTRQQQLRHQQQVQQGAGWEGVVWGGWCHVGSSSTLSSHHIKIKLIKIAKLFKWDLGNVVILQGHKHTHSNTHTHRHPHIFVAHNSFIACCVSIGQYKYYGRFKS